MMVETKPIKRKKPHFRRKDWNKKIKLGSTVKRNRKWRAAKGRHNKIRLKKGGHSGKPTRGWSADKKIRGKVDGFDVVRVENLNGLKDVGKGKGVMIGKVGKKKREEIMKVCKEKGLKILNRYLKVKSEEKEDGK